MKIKEGFVLREVAGNAIVIAVGPARNIFQGIIQLNETGKEIWNGIQEGLSIEEIVQSLTELYEVDEKVAKNDIEEIINQLQKAGILDK